MRLADFILSHMEPIVAGWEVFARSTRSGEHLDKLRLQDHVKLILGATARDMKSPQTVAERAEKSKGESPEVESEELDGASDAHAVDRLSLGFDMLEMMSEYRALRAGVIQLWRESGHQPHTEDVDDLTRFNESIDQSLSKSVASYTTRVDQARDMFLAILSHDLRNPLSAITMSAEVLPLISHDRAEVVECAATITQSADVMQRMINDLLDYTRTRLGAGMPVKPVLMDLAVLGGDLVKECRVSHPEHRIELLTYGDLHGKWDHDRIRQAISNLLGNAVQHGLAEIPITLSLRGEATGVVIEVHNGGIPIPEEELSLIFDPLVRGSTAESPQTERTSSIGMGLYIAREVARSHHGRIEVTSTADDGTSFTIHLPREAAAKIGNPILDTELSEAI